jgi:hypothetical protein
MCAVVVCLAPNFVCAQVIQRPERPIRGLFGGGPPPDPNRTRQDVTLSVSTLGGYDDNPSPQESGGGQDAFTPREPGYTGYADAALKYKRAKQTNVFEINGHAYANAYRNLGLTPSFGGDAQVRLSTPLGKHNQLDVLESARSSPSYTIGAFAPLRGDVEAGLLPDASPTYGFSIRRSFANDASVSLTTRWAARNALTESYRYGSQNFEDHISDGHRHEGSLGYTRTIGRRSGLTTSYRHAESEYKEPPARTARPIQEDTAEIGYQHEHTLSRTRRWAMEFGAGATYIQTVARVSRDRLDYAMPSGHAKLRFDVARTWSISSDYRRAVSVLEGLTAQSFVTDTALLRVGGFIGGRTELAVSTGYSSGAGAIATESGATFESYTATAQLRFLLTRWWSAVISHNFYMYRLHGFDSLPAGLRDRLDRNAVRVGMSFDLPLYGRYADRRPQTPRGN